MASQSFSTACDDLTDSVTRLSTQIGAFVRGVRSARRDLDAVSRELSSLSLCLQSLRDESDEIRYQAGFQGKLSNVIGQCNLVVGEMATLLVSSKSGGRAQWISANSDEMARLRQSLESQRSAIEIALEFLSCLWDAEAIATSEPVHNGQTSGEHDRRRLSSGKVHDQSQMAALEERVAFLQVQLSRITDNDDGYMIQRLREVTGFRPESTEERRPLTPLFPTNWIDLDLGKDTRGPELSTRRTSLSPDDDDSSLWSEDYCPPRESSALSSNRQSAGDAYTESIVPPSYPIDRVDAIPPGIHDNKSLKAQERRLPLLESQTPQKTLEKIDTPHIERTSQLLVESTNVESSQGSQDYPKQLSSAAGDDVKLPGPSTLQLTAQAPTVHLDRSSTPRFYERLDPSSSSTDKNASPNQALAPLPELGQAPATLSHAPSRPTKMPVATRPKSKLPPKGFINVEAITSANARRMKLTEEQRSALDKKLHNKVKEFALAAGHASFRRTLSRMISNPNPKDFEELLDQGADLSNGENLSKGYWYPSEPPSSLFSVIMYYRSNQYWESTARLFLERGANINEDAWEVALKYANRRQVSLLLSYGADAHAQFKVGGSKGKTSLEVVSGRPSGHPEILKVLIDYGADVHLGFPLTAAIRYLNGKCFKFLLENGVDATATGEEKTVFELVDAVYFEGYKKLCAGWERSDTRKDFSIGKAEMNRLLKQYVAVE